LAKCPILFLDRARYAMPYPALFRIAMARGRWIRSATAYLLNGSGGEYGAHNVGGHVAGRTLLE
jgi:hypothetical protein